MLTVKDMSRGGRQDLAKRKRNLIISIHRVALLVGEDIHSPRSTQYRKAKLDVLGRTKRKWVTNKQWDLTTARYTQVNLLRLALRIAAGARPRTMLLRRYHRAWAASRTFATRNFGNRQCRARCWSCGSLAYRLRDESDF